jgi:hypothetical protein
MTTLARRGALRKALATIGATALALVFATAGLVIWQLVRDPFAALPRVTGEVRSQTVARERADGREWRRVRLNADGEGDVDLEISLPDPMPDGLLPVVFVLGGLETGAHGVRHLPEAGSNVLVGYDWPLPRRMPRGMAALRILPELWHRTLLVPGEVSLAMRWIAAQPWADRERLSLVGLSLGALAVPAVQRVAAADGLAIGWTVLGYGGAPLGALLAHHPGIRPDWLRPLLRASAAILLRPLDPIHHLPHLNGAFLVLGGTDDVLIPEHAAQRLAALTPEPKAVRWIEGTHLGIGRDQDALLAEVVDRTFQWLREHDAVEPPASHASWSGMPPAGAVRRGP